MLPSGSAPILRFWNQWPVLLANQNTGATSSPLDILAWEILLKVLRTATWNTRSSGPQCIMRVCRQIPRAFQNLLRHSQTDAAWRLLCWVMRLGCCETTWITMNSEHALLLLINVHFRPNSTHRSPCEIARLVRLGACTRQALIAGLWHGCMQHRRLSDGDLRHTATFHSASPQAFEITWHRWYFSEDGIVRALLKAPTLHHLNFGWRTMIILCLLQLQCHKHFQKSELPCRIPMRWLVQMICKFCPSSTNNFCRGDSGKACRPNLHFSLQLIRTCFGKKIGSWKPSGLCKICNFGSKFSLSPCLWNSACVQRNKSTNDSK